MYHWHNEFMAESHRQDILQEVEHIRLENIAVQYRVYRPGFFARTMFNFGNWMIAKGKQLRQRYEVPCVDCPSPTGSFVR